MAENLQVTSTSRKSGLSLIGMMWSMQCGLANLIHETVAWAFLTLIIDPRRDRATPVPVYEMGRK